MKWYVSYITAVSSQKKIENLPFEINKLNEIGQKWRPN